MQPSTYLKHTTTDDKDFQTLVSLLDNELWNELNEDQATYDQFNKLPQIKTAVVLYADNCPAACGCFKQYDEDTVEIKRMYVAKAFRGKGFGKKVLRELETWATSLGFQKAILETSIHFETAKQLYSKGGYHTIANYPPYGGLIESVCMKKELLP